jgi:hypothetical protein
MGHVCRVEYSRLYVVISIQRKGYSRMSALYGRATGDEKPTEESQRINVYKTLCPLCTHQCQETPISGSCGDIICNLDLLQILANIFIVIGLWN